MSSEFLSILAAFGAGSIIAALIGLLPSYFENKTNSSLQKKDRKFQFKKDELNTLRDKAAIIIDRNVLLTDFLEITLLGDGFPRKYIPLLDQFNHQESLIRLYFPELIKEFDIFNKLSKKVYKEFKDSNYSSINTTGNLELDLKSKLSQSYKNFIEARNSFEESINNSIIYEHRYLIFEEDHPKRRWRVKDRKTGQFKEVPRWKMVLFRK